MAPCECNRSLTKSTNQTKTSRPTQQHLPTAPATSGFEIAIAAHAQINSALNNQPIATNRVTTFVNNDNYV